MAGRMCAHFGFDGKEPNTMDNGRVTVFEGIYKQQRIMFDLQSVFLELSNRRNETKVLLVGTDAV